MGKIWDYFLVFSSKKRFSRDAGGPGREAVLPRWKREAPFLGRAQPHSVYHTRLRLVQLGSSYKEDGIATGGKFQPSCLFSKFSSRGGVTRSSRSVGAEEWKTAPQSGSKSVACLICFTYQLSFQPWTWERRDVNVHLCVFTVSKLSPVLSRCCCTLVWVESWQGPPGFKDPQLNISNPLADVLTCCNTTWSPWRDFSYYQILLKIVLLGFLGL